MLDGAAPLHGQGVRPGDIPGGGYDLLRPEAADLRGPLRGIRPDPLPQFLKSEAPVFNEIPVIQPLEDDDMEHPQGQGVVRTGAELQPVVGVGLQIIPAGIHHHEPGPLFEGVQEAVAALGVRAGDGGIAPPHQHHGGVHLAVIIRRGHIAEGDRAGVDAGEKALGGAGLEPVGGADGVCEPGRVGQMMPSGPLGDGHGLHAVFLFYGEQVFRDDVVGLIPGDAPELSLAPLAHPLHGMEQAVRVIDEFFAEKALRAHPPLVHDAVRIGADLCDAPVLHCHLRDAGAVTDMAGGLVYFLLHGTPR